MPTSTSSRERPPRGPRDDRWERFKGRVEREMAWAHRVCWYAAGIAMGVQVALGKAPVTLAREVLELVT